MPPRAPGGPRLIDAAIRPPIPAIRDGMLRIADTIRPTNDVTARNADDIAVRTRFGIRPRAPAILEGIAAKNRPIAPTTAAAPARIVAQCRVMASTANPTGPVRIARRSGQLSRTQLNADAKALRIVSK